MSKIDTKDLYQEIARLIPEWPTNADVFYINWNSWYCLLGKEKLSLSATLINEWHSTKNGKLTPKDVSGGSHKKVWWKCKIGHEWVASITSRSQGGGCPFCNCLATVDAQIAGQWHPTRNRQLTPYDVTVMSNKKVWWKCIKGHEWESTISNRSLGKNCPYCSGHRVNQDNSLATVNPNLAKEWHSTKNGKLSPKNVRPGSNQKVWWKCKKGHEWQAIIVTRSSQKTGCPYCGGKKTNKENCLATVKPQIAKEWHPTKNGELTPTDVTSGSSKKVWWKCIKGHEWESTISNRTKGRGCPHCHRLRRA